MKKCQEEEREFYMRLAIKERYSKRQLVRQMDSGYYERYMLSKSKLLPEPLHSRRNPFLDSYVVEFLDLPDTFHEDDFRKALIKGMRDFILELGKDFIFVGEEYPIQVGGEDYRIDLVFFHRNLRFGIHYFKHLTLCDITYRICPGSVIIPLLQPQEEV